MPLAQVNTTTIEYDIVGSGAPLVLLHGSGVSWRMWEPQIDLFAKSFQVILPNMRGHGNSGPLPKTNDYQQLMANDTKALLDTLGIRRAHIVGESMGAVVALRFAIMYPAYIDRLVAASGYSEMPTPGAAWLLRGSNLLFSLLPMSLILKLIDLSLRTMGADTLTRRTIQRSIAVDKATFFKPKAIEFPSFTEQFYRVTAPTLIMAGQRLTMEATGGHVLQAHIPNATLALLAEAFDPLNTMRKDIFNEMVLDFLADHELKPYSGVTYVPPALSGGFRDAEP